ncbi:hypothetical protein BJ875DRAFT_542060 [Amylocarpus encephaloides]|uniref:RNase MRP protein 1 RNA binding domain-containing protein n=1 Tax=Amylocarpus encephaloides TaxID=45428 RepID=A0A9P7YL18_9HELO|nr:hypothetical protein BJ875DRAFT_542060 [Amylocarpus encephaloides]
MDSSVPLQKLTTLHQTLHLLHHRNKNQHRLTKWYKYFSEFRRHSQKLISEAQNYISARNLSKKSKFTEAAEVKLKGRLEFCCSMVERWYFAFSTVVADNQYASLGLMLIGCLARFQSVTRDLCDEYGFEIEVLGDETMNEAGEVPVLQAEQEGAKEDDLGEIISREDVVEGFDDSVLVQDETPPDVKSEKKKKRKKAEEEIVVEEVTPEKRQKKKKKRKKGDAFDDLFGSLI